MKGELVRLPGTARSLLTTSLLGARGKVAIARLLGGPARLNPGDYRARRHERGSTNCICPSMPRRSLSPWLA